MAPWSCFDEKRREKTASGYVLYEGDSIPKTDQRMKMLVQNILERIDDFIVHGNLVMKMRSGRKPPRAADQAQHVAPFHLLAVPNEHFGKMTVGGFDSMPMIDPNKIAHSRIIGCHDHFALGGGPHFFPSRGNNIHARMEGPFSGKW